MRMVIWNIEDSKKSAGPNHSEEYYNGYHSGVYYLLTNRVRRNQARKHYDLSLRHTDWENEDFKLGYQAALRDATNHIQPLASTILLP